MRGFYDKDGLIAIHILGRDEKNPAAGNGFFFHLPLRDN
jgi:hypothetical protein